MYSASETTGDSGSCAVCGVSAGRDSSAVSKVSRVPALLSLREYLATSENRIVLALFISFLPRLEVERVRDGPVES